MTAQERYKSIWNQICNRITELNLPNMTLSKENSEGWCDGASWYGEDMVSPDYYLHITPIEKHGREVYGSMKYSVGPKTVCGWYRTYEEFEQKLNDYFALVKENGYDMTPCVNYDLTRQH